MNVNNNNLFYMCAASFKAKSKDAEAAKAPAAQNKTDNQSEQDTYVARTEQNVLDSTTALDLLAQFAVMPNQNKIETSISQSLQELKNMGLTDELINQYFKYVKQTTNEGQVLEGYILKDNIVINNKKITSVEDLVKALDLEEDNTTNISYNLTELENWGLTSEEIEEYFDYIESELNNETGSNIKLSGYIIKKDIVINGTKIRTFEDLKEALALVNNTTMAIQPNELKRYGFTQSQIDRYFNKFEVKDNAGNVTYHYGLKRGIFINGIGINSFSELITVLNMKDQYLFMF